MNKLKISLLISFSLTGILIFSKSISQVLSIQPQHSISDSEINSSSVSGFKSELIRPNVENIKHKGPNLNETEIQRVNLEKRHVLKFHENKSKDKLLKENVITKARKPKFSRVKRQASEKKNYFSWKINLNVTRYENHTEGMHKYEATPEPLAEKNEKNYLGMAVYVSGKGPRQSYDELYNAWNSIGDFLKNLFGADIGQNLVSGSKVVLDFDGNALNGSSNEKPPGTEQKSSTVDTGADSFDNEGSGDIQNLKDREGKFLLGLLGFGNSQKTTTEAVLVSESSGIESENNSILNITEKSLMSNSIAPQLTQATVTDVKSSTTNLALITGMEEETQRAKFQGYKDSTTGHEFLEKENGGTPTQPDEINQFGVALDEFDTDSLMETSQGSNENCLECDHGKEMITALTESFSLLGNEQRSVPIEPTTVLPKEPSFSDSELEKYCMDLVNRLGKARSLDAEDFGSGDFIQDQTNAENNDIESPVSVLPTELAPAANTGFLSSVWNRLLGRKSRAISQVEKFPLNADIDIKQMDSGKQSEKNAAISKKTELYGRGRSVNSDNFSEMEKGNFDQITGSMPSIMDCENYFRQKQNTKMFAKPNLMDIMSNPNIKLQDFANATISPNLKEQQLQFLADLLKSGLNQSSNEVRTEGTDNLLDLNKPDISEGVESTQKFQENGDTFVVEGSGGTNFQGMITENLVLETILGIEDSLTVDSTESQANREGKFINIFGFGSGSSNMENPTPPPVQERIFGGLGNLLGFGSGEGRLFETDELDENSEFASGDFFKGSLSTPTEINELIERDNEATEDHGQERILGLLNLGGSGEGRLIENSATDVDTECEEDCFLESNATSSSLDCEDCSWDLESLKNNVSTTNISDDCEDCTWERNVKEHSTETDIPEDCDDCYWEFPAHNLTANVSHINASENCSDCLMEFQGGKNDSFGVDDTSRECDDCLWEFKNGTDNVNVSDTPRECEDCVWDSQNKDSFSNLNSTQECSDCTWFSHNDSNSVSNNKSSECEDCEAEFKGNDEDIVNTECEDCNWKFDVNENNVTETIFRELAHNDSFDCQDCDLEVTTEVKRRIFGTIFLTGSGDSGLFVDDGGPINLIEQVESTVSIPPVPAPGRRARLDDDMKPEKIPVNDEHSTVNPSEEETISTAHTPVRVDQFPRRRGRLDEVFDDIFNQNEWKSNNEIISSPGTLSESVGPITELTTKSILSTIIATVPTTKPSLRFCSSASQCNSTLNERCDVLNSSTVCVCGRSFIRHRETGRCEAKVLLETSLRLPEEKYNEDLKDKNSELYKQMRKNAIDTMWLLLHDDPELMSIVAEVDVAGFSEGSLVINWRLIVLPAVNETLNDLVKRVDTELKEAFNNQSLLNLAPLDVKNAELISISSALNPCSSSELNYCSKNAVCIRDDHHIGGFLCQCKEGFSDVSSSKKYAGEICEAICPSHFCGDHGVCQWEKDIGRHCLCSGWYFGERCHISGVVVVSSFSAINAVIVVVVLLLTFICKRRRSRASEHYGQTRGRFHSGGELGSSTGPPPSKLRDVIALEDNIGIKTSKFAVISTPMHNPPLIQVTHPTFNESSISLDYDSTFDTTPSCEKANYNTAGPGEHINSTV